jgi:lipid II:glycine glycyltransferase (peptidoglycan interpeptide bridge formation enzyme)
MSNLLQTTEWVEFQRSLGRETFEYEKEGISAKIIKHKLPFGKSYLYIPHGPEINFNAMTGGERNPVRNFVNWLKELAKKEKSIFVKIEPLDDHVAQTFADRTSGGSFKKSKKNIQPQKTVVLDIEPSMDEILERMHFKARRNVKISLQQETRFVEENKPDEFWKLLKKTTERGKFSSHKKDYYQKLLAYFDGGEDIEVKMFFVKKDNRSLAGAIVLIYAETAYYIHGASDHDEQQLRSPYRLQWEIIKYLKEIGIKKYDLWGIDSAKWSGVTKFKISLLGSGSDESDKIPNGRVVEYPGSFDLPTSWFWYMLYRAYRAVFK